MVQIGDRVRHKLNGFTGVVTGETRYMNGCLQLLVQPEHLGENGKILDGTWIDEQYWDVIEAGVLNNPWGDRLASPVAGGPDRVERATR